MRRPVLWDGLWSDIALVAGLIAMPVLIGSGALLDARGPQPRPALRGTLHPVLPEFKKPV